MALLCDVACDVACGGPALDVVWKSKTRKEHIMPAFVFAQIRSVSNPAMFAEYQGLAEPTVVQYGGKFLGGGT